MSKAVDRFVEVGIRGFNNNILPFPRMLTRDMHNNLCFLMRCFTLSTVCGETRGSAYSIFKMLKYVVKLAGNVLSYSRTDIYMVTNDIEIHNPPLFLTIKQQYTV